MIYQPYEDLVSRILMFGEDRKDRTGVGTKSLFGSQLEFDLRQGFPLLTSKRVNYEAVVKELLWFLRGETNIKTLGCKIWDEWARPDGECGLIYGHNWRRFGASETSKGTDQIAELCASLVWSPTSRRHIVTAWNPGELREAALPACHAFFQCYVTTDRHLDLKLTQRSADIALGVPFNVASYATLLVMLAKHASLTPRRLIMSFGDVHAYQNHIEGLKEQISRPPVGEKPRLVLVGDEFSEITPATIDSCRALTPANFQVENYHPHPAIKFAVAV